MGADMDYCISKGDKEGREHIWFYSHVGNDMLKLRRARRAPLRNVIDTGIRGVVIVESYGRRICQAEIADYKTGTASVVPADDPFSYNKDRDQTGSEIKLLRKHASSQGGGL
ncbi:hypothetical protein GF359_01555 [candidate division WOR-3 bacterium]|uniref:Uncharacterized protein n=1 Tax=candidate division WOR-3 bacterium TaxID=2052148 RepID=A0A9D5K939_UNCW3|nr:hypothetical protein [candidate division WOR-3 bacterium]MBD3363880.1 hypothetical protein [candidate division WOR-3 bacterium]